MNCGEGFRCDALIYPEDQPSVVSNLMRCSETKNLRFREETGILLCEKHLHAKNVYYENE